MRRVGVAVLLAAACWLAFSVGGARLLARRLAEAAGLSVTVGRLALDGAPVALVLHDVTAGPLRARTVRMSPAAVVALWRKSPALRDVILRGVRLVRPAVRASVVRIDALWLDAGQVLRFAARVQDRRGTLAFHGRSSGGHPVFEVRLQAVDARTVAPIVTAALLRRGRLDGRLRVDGFVVRGDLRARHLAVRGAAVSVRAERAAVDGLVTDTTGSSTRARRATAVGATVRPEGFPPLHRLALAARDLDSTHAGAPVFLRATLGGGRVRARGTIDPPRRGIEAAVKLDAVALAPLVPAGDAGLRVTDGHLSAHFRVAGPPWTVAGVAIALDRLRVVEAARPDATPVLAWERAGADGDRIDAQPLRARLRRAHVDGLTLRVRREPEGLWPLARLATLATAPSVRVLLATPPEGSPPLDQPPLELSWVHGGVLFEDRVVDPPARLGAAELEGALYREAGGSPRRIAGTASGVVAGASVTADFAVEGSRWRVAVDATGLDAAALDPWLGPNLGVTATGTVALHTEIDLRGREFDAPSRLTVEGLGVDERGDGPRVLGLPLARALALARDGTGALVLALPVSGAVGEAGRAVARAVTDALVPAITAPVAGGPVVIPFVRGTDALDAAAADLVDRIAALLHDRPALAVTLRGRAVSEDAAPDPEALARARAERVRDRLCSEREIPEARVRIGTPASDGAPGALADVGPSPPR
jgi:hypothetical protein